MRNIYRHKLHTQSAFQVYTYLCMYLGMQQYPAWMCSLFSAHLLIASFMTFLLRFQFPFLLLIFLSRMLQNRWWLKIFEFQLFYVSHIESYIETLWKLVKNKYFCFILKNLNIYIHMYVNGNFMYELVPQFWRYRHFPQRSCSFVSTADYKAQ